MFCVIIFSVPCLSQVNVTFWGKMNFGNWGHFPPKHTYRVSKLTNETSHKIEVNRFDRLSADNLMVV